MLAYLAMLVFAVSRYQPWEDEGRAWMDARECGFFDLTFHILRYEGHPAVWYWILWPITRLHAPFVAINWISATFAAAAVYLLLRFAPFPFWLRALLPFSFALAYEDAVVARSYCLFPLLGFWIAHLYRQPERRPIRMAIALALLANLSVHGTLVALAFAIAYAWKLRRSAALDRSCWIAACIFAASVLFVAVCIWPPKDLKAPLGPKTIALLQRLLPGQAANRPAPRPATQRPAPQRAAPQRPAPKPSVIPASANATAGYPLGERLRLTFLYPISAFAPLAVLFDVLVVVYLVRRRQSLLILAPALLAAFLVGVYIKLWHAPLIWIAVLMVLWAAWDEAEAFGTRGLQTAVAGFLGLLCILQLPWTVQAIRYETMHLTYPAEAAAKYLQSLPPGKRMDGYDHAFTLLPYFRLKPFHRDDDSLKSAAYALSDEPDLILLRQDSVPPAMIAEIEAGGYRATHNFCGTQFFPRQPLAPTCLLVLERAGVDAR